MIKVIAAINMTLDGICDHTAGIPDDEMHQHYAELLTKAGTVLYGRITFQLMTFWQTLAAHPSGDGVMDNFAMIMNKVPKMVFSHTLRELEWDSAVLADKPLEETVAALKQHSTKDVYVGSRSLILQLMKLNLIDEYQLCIHPVVQGSGMALFENVSQRTILKLIATKTFKNGAVILYYEPCDRDSIQHA